MSRARLPLCPSILAVVAALGGCSDPAPADAPPDAAPDAAPACPPALGPTLHRGTIMGDETWRAEDGPHVIEGVLSIRGGGRVTVEPCAVVLLADGAGIDVAFPGTPTTGALIAVGEPGRPIRFGAAGAQGWRQLRADAGAEVRLAHVVLEDGGVGGATLLVTGAGALPTRTPVAVTDVTIARSRGLGVWLERMAGFTAGSHGLTISGAAGPAVYTDEHGMGTLPRGSYTGNAIDLIVVDPASRLGESATLKALGVPYRIGTAANDGLVVGLGPGTERVVLTIEPGVRLEVAPGAGIDIERATGPFAASGVLIAEGRADAPIVFTSASAVPAKGDWRGLWFGGRPDPANVIRHARLEFTGADCGCVLVSCSAVTAYEGAVILTQPPSAPFLHDTTIAHGAGHGVVLGYQGAMIDFSDGVEAVDLDGCAQTLPSAATCPSPKPACR